MPADGDWRFVPALVLSAALGTGCKSPEVRKPPLRVAAAADLTLAFEEMGKLFEAHTGQVVTFSFGASGSLARQLRQGAPYDLFAAASAAFVDDAVSSGACEGDSKALYAQGKLVVWTKHPTLPLSSLADLARPELRHVAIANPEHAPYGRAARDALVRAGLWSALEPKIVLAENVRQALEFAQTGNADAAIVALSLVAQDARGKRFQVDPTLYAPLQQALVVCRHGDNQSAARAFARLVASSEGQALLERYGFATSAK